MEKTSLKFEELKTGMEVYDSFSEITGTVIDCSDIHNVLVKFGKNGQGFYCLKEGCSHEDKVLFIPNTTQINNQVI